MDPLSEETVRSNVRKVTERIARAADAAGRRTTEIRLVSVSKMCPVTAIEEAVAAGLTDFGENRVQEALSKMERTAALPIRWHLIGHLQSNKTRSAAARFDWIHSVESERLLRRLDQAAAEAGTTPRVLIQVDLAGEATKYGASVDEVPGLVRAGQACRAVTMRGLMLMPPWHDDPERVRPYFRQLRELRDALVRDGADPSGLAELSMGMSHDFDVAIEEGATMVRVGTAIFGPRAPAATSPHGPQ